MNHVLAAADTLYVVFSTRLREVQLRGRERGLTTTEVAVLTFILVAIAVAMGAILWQYASDTVDAAPTGDELVPDIGD